MATERSSSHLPSLHASAFFSPMSSQRLQAQRGQRATSYPPRLSEDDQSQPPPSRGTEVSEYHVQDRAFTNMSNRRSIETMDTNNTERKSITASKPDMPPSPQYFAAPERQASRPESKAHSSILKPEEPKANLGKNWEYFDGNTLFLFGGRLQTAKDKPISAATALLVLLPGALFFGFS